MTDHKIALIKDAGRSAAYIAFGMATVPLWLQADFMRGDPHILQASQAVQDYAFSGKGFWQFIACAEISVGSSLAISRWYHPTEPLPLDQTWTIIPLWLLTSAAWETVTTYLTQKPFDLMDIAAYTAAAGVAMIFNAASSGMINSAVEIFNPLRKRRQHLGRLKASIARPQ